jgi:hypothetical protein
MNLPRALRSAIALVLLLVLPGPVSAQETSGVDAATLRAIESQVSSIRGLQPLSEVELRVLDETGLQQYLLESFDRDYLSHERESDQKELVALGLIKSSDDIVQMQLNLYQEQVLGIYDPDDKLMFVIRGGNFGVAQKITYAHEFNHALQDQYFDLNQIAPKHPLSNDRSLAVHALIEGDAVLLQNAWARSFLTDDDKRELIQSVSAGDDGLATAPLILRSELLFPYTDGARFVRQVYAGAQDSYAAVDQLFRNPPESTQQILHPEKYFAGVRPVEVDLPDISGALGDDWRRVGGGVLGELDTRVLIEQYGDPAEARRVAAGWSGDRWLLLERGGRSTIVLRNTWESEDAAAAFFSAYKRGLRARFPSAMTDDDSSARQALSTPTAATDLRISGRDVQAVIGFERSDIDTVLATLASAPATLLAPVPAP